ncbi:MAG TPA: hypothetical protein VFA19_12415 [Gaiellaceae bacterium]|nr:hypothetical protein [Gaiellaceae bacterium]
MIGVSRRLGAWVLWWVALFWLWMLLAGDWNLIEWVAAACAATLAATIVELARTAAGIEYRIPARQVAASWSVLPMVLVDFGIVMWVLVRSLARREIHRGSFRTRGFEAGGDAPAGAALRAWTVLAAGYSPNAYVIDIDPERNVVLLHDLVPYRRSEEPA